MNFKLGKNKKGYKKDYVAPETLELLEKRWDAYKADKSIALTLEDAKKRTEKRRVS